MFAFCTDSSRQSWLWLMLQLSATSDRMGELDRAQLRRRELAREIGAIAADARRSW